MRLKLSYGRQELLSQFSGDGTVTVKLLLQSVKSSHSDIYNSWCDREGHLHPSLPVFVNQKHIRYARGLDTELGDGDEIYIIPIIAGG